MHFDDDLPVLVVDTQKNSDRTIHILRTDENEDTPLRTTKKQPLYEPVTEKNLELEQ